MHRPPLPVILLSDENHQSGCLRIILYSWLHHHWRLQQRINSPPFRVREFREFVLGDYLFKDGVKAVMDSICTVWLLEEAAEASV